MNKIKIVVNFIESLIQVVEKDSNKLLFQVGMDKKKSFPMDSGDLEIEYIPEQFESDDK